MGIKFWDFIRPKKDGKTGTVEITCAELFEASREFQLRELCFRVCVDMVANAMGRCEFRTFRRNEEIFERDYYLWNFEPNVNENSTEFMHKLITRLYTDNEALIISTRKRDGYDALVVADSWQKPLEYPSRQKEYKGVVVGEVEYDKTFRENEVLHIKLNHKGIKPVIDAMYASYYRLYDAAVRAYEWGRGQHWKVHVNQIAQGADDFGATFKKLLEDGIKPFFNSGGSVLPEFDGYQYEDVGSKSAGAAADTREVRNLAEDIFEFTARGFLIPMVLVNGKVEATADANTRFLTNCIDPICDQLQEEIVRKRYGYEEWRQGNFLRVDSSSIIHFDLFANAASVEKLVGSGAYTINDLRRAANQATINEPWADAHYMTLNISTMGQATRSLDEQKGG